MLGTLGSIVSVRDNLVGVCLEADEAVGVLQRVGSCSQSTQVSATLQILLTQCACIPVPAGAIIAPVRVDTWCAGMCEYILTIQKVCCEQRLRKASQSRSITGVCRAGASIDAGVGRRNLRH